MIADRFSKKNPLNLSRIAIAGSALAWPAFVGSVLFTNNLLATVVCLNIMYLFGECSWPANISMMQRAGTPEQFARTVSVYNFFNYIGGSISTAFIGLLIHRYGATYGVGKILAIICSFAYAASIASWWKAGKYLK